MSGLRHLLAGGDRRGLAKSEQARALVRAAPERVPELAALAQDQDWLVAMRAVDLLEKLARERVELVKPFKRLFLGPLADRPQWEIRLQIVRILPLLPWTARERARVLAILERDVGHPQKFVRAWALDGLAAFAKGDAALRRLVLRHAGLFERSGSKALATRARDVRARLARPRAIARQQATRQVAAGAPSSQPYLVAPRRGGGPGVLVLHPWWGLTGAVRGICDRLAAEGFVAMAPDLFGGRLASTVQEARRLRSARRAEPMWKTITRAIDALLAHRATVGRRIAVVGLSMGGHWALWLASRPESPVAATVVFYAARAAAFAKGPSAAFQLHLAEHDDFVSPAALARLRRALRAAGRRCETWVYPGTHHWFFEADRPEHDPGSAALAWARMLAFLRAELPLGAGRPTAKRS